ncbi:cysteine-rich VLP protein [Evansella clarkii]|uniref:cysteine-rich VLP protein n=1 Tax=Evansella clarkii TaxID=79879 RepID=UPI000B441AB8
MGLKEQIQKSVRDKCATYDRDGDCFLQRDGCYTCVYFRDDTELPRCPYFENAVLPGSDSLHSRYWNAFGGGGTGKPCERCGNMFETTGRKKHCDDCRTQIQRDQARIRKQRQRAKEKHG